MKHETPFHSITIEAGFGPGLERDRGNVLVVVPSGTTAAATAVAPVPVHAAEAVHAEQAVKTTSEFCFG